MINQGPFWLRVFCLRKVFLQQTFQAAVTVFDHPHSDGVLSPLISVQMINMYIPNVYMYICLSMMHAFVHKEVENYK